MLIIRFLWKPETDKFDAYDLEAMKKDNPPLSVQGKITTVIFVAMVFVRLFPQFGAGLFPQAVTYLNQIGTCVPPIIALALVCIIHVDGKPIARFPDLVKTVPMGLLIFTATVTVLGAAVNLEISTWLYNILSPVLSGLPTMVIMIILVLGALIATQFMSNTVTMYLFYAIAISLLSATGINMPAFVIIVGLAAMTGILTPAAAVPAPLFFGPEHLTVAQTAKYAVIYLVLMMVSLMVIIWPLSNMLIHF